MERHSRGRPREFDMDEVLDKAVSVFRKQGYHGTSISDLAAATGLTGGSIYKAFRVKDAVFRAAFERYNRVRNEQLEQLFKINNTGREKIHDLIVLYVENSYGEKGRQGCLVVGGAVEISMLEKGTARYVENAFDHLQKTIERMIKIGHVDGSISRSVDAAVASRFILCLLQGIRVVGKTAPTKRDMMAAAELALRAVS